MGGSQKSKENINFIKKFYSCYINFKCDCPEGIKEIAKLAGISIGTVDRVLHNRGRVSSETRQKIEEIIRQIGYKPNLIAKSLVMNKKFRISLLIPEPSQDEYWQQAYKGVENATNRCSQLGVQVEPHFYSLENKSTFEDCANKIIESSPNGIIMAPNFLDEGKKLFEHCKNFSIPVIMFDSAVQGMEPFGFIGTNSYQTRQVAAQLLHISTSGIGKFAILHFDEEKGNSPHMLDKEKGFMDYVTLECPQREVLTLVLNNKKHFYSDQLQSLFEKNQIESVFVSTSKTYRV